MKTYKLSLIISIIHLASYLSYAQEIQIIDCDSIYEFCYPSECTGNYPNSDNYVIKFQAFDSSKLLKLEFVPESEAKSDAEFILSAPPQEWKSLLTKETKFITDFMLNKVTLEQGSKVGILKIAPRADILVDSLTQFDLYYQDDMSPEEVDEYRAFLETSKVGQLVDITSKMAHEMELGFLQQPNCLFCACFNNFTLIFFILHEIRKHRCLFRKTSR